MTPEQAIKALSNLPEDTEEAHSTADRILLEVLRSHGLGEVANAFELARDDVGFWYA